MIDVIGTSTSPARRLTLTRSKWRASRSGTLRGAKLAKQDIHVGDGGDFIYPRRSAFKYEQDSWIGRNGQLLETTPGAPTAGAVWCP
jgi:hypothetical protein